MWAQTAVFDGSRKKKKGKVDVNAGGGVWKGRVTVQWVGGGGGGQCGRIRPTGNADWPQSVHCGTDHWPTKSAVTTMCVLWCGLVSRARKRARAKERKTWDSPQVCLIHPFSADLSQAVHSFLSSSPSRQSNWPFDPEQSVLLESWRRPRPKTGQQQQQRWDFQKAALRARV